ncbi:mediator of RNA polymerase II transcription subunit 15-like [Eupeodes corollae]|uniref:mediator of RNA polymerase II transcription subunit 15-like n=1 Tax=Eupeodes corollae TaxID=290404 RepID=UPI002492213E|nr:mediator of RNA polymerase II transcription subunit 15-like [Eupeodes corollae]
MSELAFRRPDEMFDVTNYLPDVHAEFHEVMYGILILKQATNVNQIAHQRLRFNSSPDRRLMQQYQQMGKFIFDIQELKEASPQNAPLMDKILKLIHEQNRNETLESLRRYDNVLDFASKFYPKQIKNFFEVSYLKIEKVLQNNPLGNHTIRRTFRTKRNYVFVNDIKVPNKYQLCRQKDLDKVEEIPHALQGEIAGLNGKFKLTLDPTRINKSIIRLMCVLEDDLLPCVPPIYIDVSDKYPYCSPTCIVMQHDYSITSFLTSVKNYLSDYILKLPKLYSVTHILNSWEMSVRMACRPKQNVKVNIDSFSMLYEMLTQ